MGESTGGIDESIRAEGAVDGTWLVGAVLLVGGALLVGGGPALGTALIPEAGGVGTRGGELGAAAVEGAGLGGAELGGAALGGAEGISPALRRRCIADSNASLFVAGGGGMARQLAMRLRSRRASTSKARFFAELSPWVSRAMVWSSAPSATFQEAELARGTIRTV